MVTKWTAVAAMLVATFARADGMAGEGSEPRLLPLRLPAIVSVTIEENAAKSPAAANEAIDCSGFVLTRRDVSAFLRRARTVAEHDYWHMLDWSPCYASGRVEFVGGLAGTWGIQQLRGGSLALSDGRTLYLYCPRCRSGPFLGP